MKKLLIAAVAAIFAVMLVAPVYAADNLELSGKYRLRAWSVDDNNFAKGDDSDYFDQRMRVKAKINVADDAYAVIRADLGEGTWGDDFQYGIARPDTTAGDIDNVIDFDRLYMHLDKGVWSATIGEQYVGLGILEVLDSNPTAINLGIHPGPVDLSLIYGKLDENGSTNDDIADDNDLYALNVSFQMAQFDSNVFAAGVTDGDDLGGGAVIGGDTKLENEPFALGFHTQGSVGMVNLVGELVFFGGDYKNLAGNTIDYKGTQAYFKADADVTDMVNVGGEILYAKGYDDADEEQIESLVDWWTFTPMGMNTPAAGDISATDSNPFDPSDSSGGVKAITVFTEINPMEALGLGAKIGYFAVEEDDNTMFDDALAYNMWAAYDIATNTTASLTYQATNPDFESGYTGDDETEQVVYGKIQLNF